MKISVWQIMARVLITVMTVGAIVLLTCYLIIGQSDDYDIIRYNYVPSETLGKLNEPAIAALCQIFMPVSYLLELLGMLVWPLATLMMMTPVSTYCVLMVFLLGNLFLSRYLTKLKGTRTAITVNLALVLIDLQFSTVCSTFGSKFGLVASGVPTMIANIVIHLLAAFFLIMSLRYTYRHDDRFSDLRPSPYAYQIKSYNSEMREGMTDEEIVAVWRRLTVPRIARVLTILVAVGTLLTLSLELIIHANAENLASAFGFLGIVGFFAGSVLCSFLAAIGMDSDLPVWIGMGLSILVFIAALFFMQRFFTRDSRLTKPALVFTLTAAVIDTLPFFSLITGVYFINAFIHILWIVMLVISLTKVCRREKKAPEETAGSIGEAAETTETNMERY